MKRWPCMTWLLKASSRRLKPQLTTKVPQELNLAHRGRAVGPLVEGFMGDTENLINVMEGWVQRKHKETHLANVAKRFDELAEHHQIQGNLLSGWQETGKGTFSGFKQPEFSSLRVRYDGNGGGSPFWLQHDAEKPYDNEKRISDVGTLFRLLKEHLSDRPSTD